MYLARVIGNIVSTSKDESLIGTKLLIIQKVNEKLESIESSEIAVDTVGAGAGEIVLVAKGSSARCALSEKNMPVDASIVGIVDSVEVNI